MKTIDFDKKQWYFIVVVIYLQCVVIALRRFYEF